MNVRPTRRLRRLASRGLAFGFAAMCGLTCLSLSSLSAMAQGMQRLQNTVPSLVSQANLIGDVPGNQSVSLVLALPMRNEAQLDALLTHLYDPNDPLYGLYLTTAQFNANYAPTQADYNAIISYVQAQGLTVTSTSGNRMILEVTGPAHTIQSAFNVHLRNYKLPTGRIFRAPEADPSLPVAIARRLKSIIGLDDTLVIQHNSHVKPIAPLAFLNPFQIGSGPFGGLSPGDIKNAYNLNGTTLSGSGQTLALLELDGYAKSDITHYEDFYNLPHVPLGNELIGGFSGVPGDAAIEVTLDIEMMAALAPGAKKIDVYEGPRSGLGILEVYNRIAVENTGTCVSTSWGVVEINSETDKVDTANIQFVSIEALAFKQMAVQGQSFFAASGDSGAYNDSAPPPSPPIFALSVNDPASQPFATGVGGTTLRTNGANGPWQSETNWAEEAPQSGNIWDRGDPLNPTDPGGGGGGISVLWQIPKYQSQSGVVTRASNASKVWRNVPDVSLNADPNTGYSIYIGGNWQVVGGTSAAAPLWAAFTALVNQKRSANGLPPLGFANPAIYSIGLNPTKYANDFHDIADNSTNLYTNYKAVSGYDLTSGWGSFNGVNLLADLATFGTPPPAPPVAAQLLGNPGFENGSSNPRPWFTTAGVIDSSSTEPSHGGTWKAWLGGYPTPRQDLLFQQVTLPGNITTATLSFYLHIDTAKTNTTTVHDTLVVQVRSNSNTVLATLGTFTNLNAASGYTQQTFDMSAYKGQTVQVYLVSLEDGKIATSFVVDDFALNVQ